MRQKALNHYSVEQLEQMKASRIDRLNHMNLEEINFTKSVFREYQGLKHNLEKIDQQIRLRMKIQEKYPWKK